MTRSRSSWGRRLAGLALRVLIPAAITAIAAGLGYAFAVYPIWYHVDQVRKTETLGGLISVVEARKQFLGAYLDDSRVDASAFDDIAWAVKTVMTPFVGYAPAPGQQHNAHINSFQFRDRREPAMPKPAGVTRIFLTGASVAFSAGAPDDQRTIGGYLQALLDRPVVRLSDRLQHRSGCPRLEARVLHRPCHQCAPMSNVGHIYVYRL